MKKPVLVIVLLIASLASGHALKCFCHSTFAVLECESENNSTCETDGFCYAQFVIRRDQIVEEYNCLSIQQISDGGNVCLRSNQEVFNVFQCCYEEDCNRGFIGSNNFTTTTTDPSSIIVPVAVPIAVVLPLLIAIGVIIVIIAIRCRKKHLEGVRRGNNTFEERELSCDLMPYTLDDEETDLSGSGFGVPHLEQRTIARSIRIGELIGAGRFGQVLLGDYQGETVAVKKFLSIDGQSWQREIEVYTTNLVTHDGILRFIASDMISNNGATELWLITQFHSNGSLYDYINRKELSAKTLVLMLISICSGLSHLHTELHGTIKKVAIAHRDIKSKNILVKNDLRCCIADFGLAVTKGEDSYLNMPKNPKQGTKRYMAPEILNETINMRYFKSFQHSDVYSLGLVFWEMCRRCGGTNDRTALDYEPPFHGLVPCDPSFEDMKRIVVVEKRQPSIPATWRQDDLMKGLLQLMRECWVYNSETRPNVLYIKKKLNKLSQEDKLDYEKAIE